MSAGDDVAAACCGICCVCGFGALASWCNGGAVGRGGRTVNCCPCFGESFNEDSMDRWDKDKAQLREKTSQLQPGPSDPMSIPSSNPEPSPTSETTVGNAMPITGDGK